VLFRSHENELPFINGGHHVEWAPDIPIWLSLLVIIGTLVVTTVASLLASRKMSAAELDAHTGPRRGVHEHDD
jgi:tellurite resistance protein TerC